MLSRYTFCFLLALIKNCIWRLGCANVRNHEMFYVTIDAEMSEFVNNFMMSGKHFTLDGWLLVWSLACLSP